MTALEIALIRRELEKGITTNHSGKMHGKWSFSTSKKLNPLCEKRSHNKNLICAECYAESTINRYKNLDGKLRKNHQLITTQILPLECFPIIPMVSFRLESFGDIATVEQVVNYFNWANVNKHCFFVLWSKNPHIIKKAIDTYGIEKPSNFRIIFSSCHLNKEQAEIIKRLFPFIDKVFTVYTADYATENDITINCGGNNCLECNRCYDPNNSEFFINEILKSDLNKFKKACSALKKFLQIA